MTRRSGRGPPGSPSVSRWNKRRRAREKRDMTVVVLTGRTGGKLAAMLRETDVLISVPHDRAARVREVHALVLHCLSDGVDAQLLGEQENPL